MHFHCVWGTCKSDSRKKEAGSVLFLPFPKPCKDLKAAKRWTFLCGRGADFTIKHITKNTYICSKHFGKDEILSLRQNPTLEPANARPSCRKKLQKERKSRTSMSAGQDIVAPEATPSRPLKTYSRKRTREPSPEPEAFLDHAGSPSSSDSLPSLHYDMEIMSSPLRSPDMLDSISPPRQAKLGKTLDKQVQVDMQRDKGITGLRKENVALKIERASLRRQLKAAMTTGCGLKHKSLAEEKFEWMKKTESRFYFFTGLSEKNFQVLLQFLKPEEHNIRYWSGIQTKKKKVIKVSHECQLAITLWRLRRGTTLVELSHHFGLSEQTLRPIFITWIQFLNARFETLRDALFVPKKRHKKNLPQVFRNKILRDTRVVIDCTELFTELPGNYRQMGNMYSQYKSHSTAKVLIGVAPKGAFMYMSEVFEGSISDRDIVQKSDFISRLDPGDVVLADRGFTIHDLCAKKQALLVIPPFKDGRDHLTKEETLSTKMISRARIHVERFNERLKKYRILQGIIPLSLTPLLSQIVYITCCLVNFQSPLVKK